MFRAPNIGAKYYISNKDRSIGFPTLLRGKAKTSNDFFGVSPSYRRQSALASDTAVNSLELLSSPIKQLHSSLNLLGKKAADYVNLSELQLALRGLEARNAVVRIGVSYAQSVDEASDLLDGIFAEQSVSSEDRVTIKEKLSRERAHTILLRHPDHRQILRGNSPIPTTLIDNPLLRDHNLEVLITKAPLATPELSSSDVLVPVLEIQTPVGSRPTTITWPVHRTIIVGNGASGAFQHGKLLASDPQILDDPDVKLLLQTSSSDGGNKYSALTNSPSAPNQPQFVDTSAGDILKWMSSRSLNDKGDVKPVVIGLIQRIISDIARSIRTERSSAQKLGSSASEGDSGRLAESIDRWAEAAHEDLRDGLESAFQSKKWRQLSWWKLLWRVDDVDVVATDLLEHTWLTNAERGLIWTYGHFDQAGLLASSKGGLIQESRGSEDVAANEKLDEAAKPDQLRSEKEQPWLSIISSQRQVLLNVTVPPLHDHAQKSLSQFMTTTSGSAALSVLSYLAYSSVDVFQAGVITTFGTVLASWLLQRRWENARSIWVQVVRERGRETLKAAEADLRARLQDSQHQRADDTLRQAYLAEVEVAIGRVRHDLDRIPPLPTT